MIKKLLIPLIIISLILTPLNTIYALTQDEETFLDAAVFGDEDVIKDILQKNININIQDDVGNTALILACMEGHIQVVKLLVEANADKSVLNKHGNNALFYAKQKNYSDIIKLIE
ncbi:ankyrin repeat domain-containing protein [uncultured Brachyspira sp.]|uniref:ankyrin repeat domain-containing protein n=1 Tax=uncultured Brachyspira sp. TaxID=221953 RepID=UPI00263785B2|nr:ankyrin repeat domain-containing protein [uncultured Brachyspira sp.]